MKNNKSLYKTIWRWHFYAGIFIAPFLFILAVTGGIYLFKPQIEEIMYQDYYQVEVQADKTTPQQQVDTVLLEYPDATVTSYRPGETDDRSAEVGISLDGASYTIFVDPYTTNIVGELNDQHRIFDRVEEFHGELMLGTWGDRIVELAACWIIILLVTGLFIWFPRKKKRAKGTIIPRLNQNKRIFFRDMHAVTGFWLSLAILFLVFSGLFWSGFLGTKIQNTATNLGVGYPPSIWVGNAPESTVLTKDIADVAWPAESMPVPESTHQQGFIPVSINEVVSTANETDVYPTYEVFYPSTPTGVYTISAFSPKAQDEATMHIDQYTGAILADYRYEHYEPIGKLIATGITIHKGLEFGLANQIIGALVCLGIIAIVVSGIIMWWKRKPDQHLGAPIAPSVLSSKVLIALLIIFSLLLPLLGISVIVIFLLDWLVIRRVPSLKRIFQVQ
ncbi:PepSY domain-containing protein [Gracilibacillus caseinilyticus]|uniref:PepSY domain-containing protein n=1 Tax=Gracilibacillus caseinilyticus TaxID=2932256 RepID=A0ABY4EY13_9BACI|nr:PepSY domain-containing protein [Gracilibacillus caseinilyticus]UOQ49299.1 PepSY domain-containing protein [Gracilibacillus caseinilyticus]